MKNHLIAAAVITFGITGIAFSETAKRPIDDAFFVMQLRPEIGTTFATANRAAGNLLKWSGTDGNAQEATGTGTGGELICITNCPVVNPLYPMTTNDMPCLYLPQSSYYAEDDPTYPYCSARMLKIENAASSSKTQTAYARFRWDGNACTNSAHHGWIFTAAYSWGPATGWGAYVENYTGANPTSGYIAILVGHHQPNMNLEVKKGKWYDLFCIMEPSATSTNAQVRAYLIEEKVPKLSEGAVVFDKPSILASGPVQCTYPFRYGSVKYIAFGAEGYYAYEKVKTGNIQAAKAFRGAIARFMTWDRALTTDEMIMVASGYHGATWSVGSANGSSDEFAASAAAADETFVTTNEWRRMRKTLTAETPALTVKGAIPTYYAKLGHILSIWPLFDANVGETCPVTVSVCGKTLPGSFDLRTREGRNVFVPARYWVRDAAGACTVTISRTGAVTGTLSIDALTLCGSWIIGTPNGSNDGMRESYVFSTYVQGDPEVVKHRQRAICYAASIAKESVQMFLPDEVAAQPYRYLIDTKPLSMIAGLEGKAEIAAYVNNVLVTNWTGLSPSQKIEPLQLPDGALRAGLNTVTFSNAAPGSVGDWNNWMNVDYFRLEMIDQRHGGMVILK